MEVEDDAIITHAASQLEMLHVQSELKEQPTMAASVPTIPLPQQQNQPPLLQQQQPLLPLLQQPPPPSPGPSTTWTPLPPSMVSLCRSSSSRGWNKGVRKKINYIYFILLWAKNTEKFEFKLRWYFDRDKCFYF